MLSELENQIQHPQHVNVVITVKHLHCPKCDNERLQLTDTTESLWHDVRHHGYAFDKLHFIVAPRNDDIISRKEDLLVKSVLFDFLISTDTEL